jgi:hypothetical protein
MRPAALLFTRLITGFGFGDFRAPLAARFFGGFACSNGVRFSGCTFFLARAAGSFMAFRRLSA